MKRGETQSYSNGWSAEGSGRYAPEGANLNGEQNATNNTNGNAVQRSTPQQRAVPGRPRKRMPLPPITTKIKRKSRKKGFCQRFYARWIKGIGTTGHSSLALAITAWYLLGVLSIGTSKLLLTTSTTGIVGGVPPLYLTLQQLLLGCLLFRSLLAVRAFGSAGLQPWPSSADRINSIGTLSPSKRHRWAEKSINLLSAGLFFALGFLTTNFAFNRSSAAFVETIKAAEPITSAGVAVAWGIEVLGGPEVLSLATIVTGVLISTLSNGPGKGAGAAGESSIFDSLRCCLLVMTTNLCFSFRGLNQKLFRSSPSGSTHVVDDLNLQYRMQQIGSVVLCIPVLLLDAPGIVVRVWKISTTVGLFQSGALVKYLGLSLVNGFAFASYNLASTFVLSRVSVVHHAALNCIRRIFAIVVTSIAFGIPITLLGACGIVLSFIGFLFFTHHKAKRQSQPRPLSSLLPMSAV